MKKNPDHLERIEVLKHLIALQVTLLQICVVFNNSHKAPIFHIEVGDMTIYHVNYVFLELFAPLVNMITDG